jgi:hypothetical protein
MDLINILSNTNEYLCIADITSLQIHNQRLKILISKQRQPPVQETYYTSAIL